MLEGVLLDIDGTLVLSNDAHARSWVEAFAGFGYEIKFEEVRPLIGMGGDKLISALRPELTAEKGVGKEITEARSGIFLEKYAPDLQPAPGSRELVKALQKKGLKLIAASSSTEQELHVLLKAAQVDDLLTDFTSADDADNSKPDSDIVFEALDRLGVHPDDALMIGDTIYDIEAAGRLGVQCVAVRTGGWPDEKLVGAFVIYDDPAAMVKNLDECLLKATLRSQTV
jgi:HAD superfamily hydrolase (TIGR01509 family)